MGWRKQRGAILVQVAIMLIGLLALTAFVIDQGVMLVSRGQAQNAADAGALAAATYLAFDSPGDQPGAQAIGEGFSEANWVWGQPPDVTPADVTFPPCPPGAPGPADQCVRVDVFRNQRPGGSPLPVFFASLVGVSNQGVRATATAQVFMGDTSQCLKPWAILDKWFDSQPGGWDPDAVYEEAGGDYYVPTSRRRRVTPAPDSRSRLIMVSNWSSRPLTAGTPLRAGTARWSSTQTRGGAAACIGRTSAPATRRSGPPTHG